MGIENDPVKEELIKRREIHFCAARAGMSMQEPGSIDRDASEAKQLLENINGIVELDVVNKHCIAVAYNVSILTMRIIEEALQEVGFVLDSSLLCKMRRALYYYTEETQLVNMGYTHHNSKSTTEIFIKQYEQRKHGCRDERPAYYHHYN